MVTALNHVVADGRRAGGLNLSSCILTDYRGREKVRQAKVPASQKLRHFERTVHISKENQYFGSLDAYYTDTPPFFLQEAAYCTWSDSKRYSVSLHFMRMNCFKLFIFPDIAWPKYLNKNYNNDSL